MIHSSMISTGQINAVSGRDMTIDLINSLDASEITLNAFNDLIPRPAKLQTAPAATAPAV